MSDAEVFETKSVTCSQLPAEFIVDKQEARKFFIQFGPIKNFIYKPSRQEYTVEFATLESAQKALNAQVNFLISPTRQEQSKSSDEIIDPDVQAELESMLPVGSKTNVKQTIENFIKNPPQMLFKSKLFSAPKQKTEPITVNADQGQIQMAKSELENLAKKPARTLEEKFAILDARDKLYRLLTARPMDIKKATSTKGTCKDMCPEKERLMREARLQVASFELDENSEFMDPSKAIKQYSRSSADQEIPLPHELRSEEILKATMTYMLHNIIDLCDDDDTSIGDWYHFVWDRTRGIRKDITQQELCSQTSVELLEQCARFHIHCSARLVAEEPGIFDQKINDENLTKSLQTLKYMYDDLKLKSIKCKNEAEFRAYVVLLNLNESGNFLWEIKRLEKDILKSEEMRFALDVYFALAFNNYVKFFNLVRKATYMNACILMKYFTQVRLKALNTISMTVFSAARKGFNISYLTKILAFENDEVTANFLQYHGSICDLESNSASLVIQMPELPFPMERSMIVEEKMQGTVSEAVCGGILPSADCFLKLQLHSSFDENGYLKKSAFYAEDQNGPLPVKDNIFKVPKESPPISPKNIFQQKVTSKSDQADGSPSNNIFTKSNPFENQFSTTAKTNIFGSFNTFSSNSSSSGTFSSPSSTNSLFGQPKSQSSVGTSTIFGSPQNILQSSFLPKPSFITDSPKSSIVTSITSPSNSFNSSPSGSISSLSSQEYIFGMQMKNEDRTLTAKLAEEQRLKEEKIKKENEEAEERMRQKLQEKIRMENERREAERLRLEEEERRRKEIEENKRKKLEKDAEKIYESLVNEIVESRVTNEITRAHKLYVELPRDFYDVLEYDVVVEELISIYQQEHLSYINTTKHKYETMLKYFNHWRRITAKEINRRKLLSNIGCPSLNKSLEEYAHDISHPQQHLALSNMKQYLSGSPQQIKIPDLDSYKKIDMFKDLNFSRSNLPNKLFWKILISVPMKNIEQSMSFACFLRKWLSKTFDVDNESGIFYLKRQFVHQLQMMMSICIRKTQGLDCADEKGEICTNIANNANSLLFFCTTADLKQSRKRLQNILNKLENPISVSIIVYKNLVEDTDEELLRHHMDLTFESKVKNFEISLYYENQEKSKDLTDVVIESCQFLCDNYLLQFTMEYSGLFDLEMQHLLDFAQLYFGDEMWKRIELSCKDNKAFNSYMISFNNVIQVFNACIDRIVNIVTIKSKCLPSLPTEFRALLPTMEVRIPHSFEYFPENWKIGLEQKNLATFLRDLRLKTMKNDKFNNFQDFKEKLSGFLEINLPSFKNEVFQAVVEKIIHNFYVMQLSGLESVDDAIPKMRWFQILGCIVVGKFNELYLQRREVLPTFVIYYKKDLKNYLIPWWYAINFNASNDYDLQPITKKPKITKTIDSNELQTVLKKGMDSLKKANEIINKSRDNTIRTREDSKSFDQYLYKCEEKFRGMKRSLQSMQEKS